ncbi:MAG TPA: VOC family protein [Terracidiphilus sp.]|nr:VOC family protein [Terracidiphilus sp.]
MDKIINWFEIPALDLGRARAFYETVLGVSLNEQSFGSQTLAIFPYNRETATGGCVILGPGYRPGAYGPIVYLNCGKDLNGVLNRVATAGGSIATPRTELPPGMGAFAHICDSEGNRVGLHGQA